MPRPPRHPEGQLSLVWETSTETPHLLTGKTETTLNAREAKTQRRALLSARFIGGETEAEGI